MRRHLADVDVTVTMTQPNPDAPAIVQATNYMHNGGFYIDVGGWRSSYGTGTIEYWYGMLQATGNGSNSAFAVRSEASTWSGVSAGDTVYCRALVRTLGGQTPTGCVGRFSFDGTLVIVDPDGWDPQGSSDGWHSLEFSATVPDSYTGGPCYVIVGEWLPATTTSNDRMQVDDVIVSTENVPFFDGHTEGSGAVQYRWVGTPNASASQQYITGDTITVNTTDAEAAFLGEVPSAVHTMTGQWQQSSSRDHPTPGKLSLQLILDRPEHRAIDYESDVVVMMSIRGQQPFPFWRGWIDDIEITRRVVHHPDTRVPVVTWTWDITVGDILARAAATKINDKPWPKQHIFSVFEDQGRLNAIQKASPIPLISPLLITGIWAWQWTGSDWVRPRDVDNVDVLSLCQAMSPIGAQLVHESFDGVTFRGNPGINELVWFELYDGHDLPFTPYRPNQVNAGTWRVGPGSEDLTQMWDPNTTMVPADAIVETSRRINRATLLNEVSIGWYDQTETQRDSYRRNTTRQASTSQHRVATDYIEDEHKPPLGPPPVLLTAADSWLSMTGRPTRALTATRVLTDRVDTDALVRLCTLGRRGTVGLEVDALPDDLSLSWRVIAGSATVNAGLLDLSLTLEPASLSGQEPMTWDELPEPTTARFSDGETVVLDVKFTNTGVLPYAAFSHVAKSAVRTYDGPN